MEISEVLGYDRQTKEIIINPLYVFEEDPERTSVKHVVGSLVRTDNKMMKTFKLRQYGYQGEI